MTGNSVVIPRYLDRALGNLTDNDSYQIQAQRIYEASISADWHGHSLYGSIFAHKIEDGSWIIFVLTNGRSIRIQTIGHRFAASIQVPQNHQMMSRDEYFSLSKKIVAYLVNGPEVNEDLQDFVLKSIDQFTEIWNNLD